MSIENNSSRVPYPWYLETNKGSLPHDSPEVRSFRDQSLIPEDIAVSGLTVRLVIKNRNRDPLQDVRVFEIFSNLVDSLHLDPTQKESVRSVVRELEQNADQYGNLTEASLTQLDSLPGMLGVVVSNVVPPEKVDKVRLDDDLFKPAIDESTGDDDLDKLIARIKTSGRGLKLVAALADGRQGRFEYHDRNTDVPTKMASYAILYLPLPVTNGDTTLAA
jgi:hypothetical protein